MLASDFWQDKSNSQKVIKENGTKKILSFNNQNKNFTPSEKTINQGSVSFETSKSNLSEAKRNKLKNVLNDLIQLRKDLDKDG